MRKLIYLLSVAKVALLTSCSTPKLTTTEKGGTSWIEEKFKSDNDIEMEPDSEPITHTIDISTQAGQIKLQGLSLQEARELVLVEALMANKCATFLTPQFTHLVEKGKVLRITFYGFPVRYKNKPEQ